MWVKTKNGGITMKELIDKAAIVAEIEKVMDEPTPPHDPQCPWEDGYLFGLSKAESIIDTIEVKEVDLDKEIKKYINDNIIGYCIQGTEETAKHFFELGLKAKKGE